MIKQFTAAVLLAATSFAAYAGDLPKFYVGGDVGSTKITAEDGIPSETSYGIFGGYNINDIFAIEAGYRRLGKWSGPGGSVDVKQSAVSVLAFAPVVDHVAVFGRLGYNRISGSTTVSDFGDLGHENHALFGFGVSYEFAKHVTGRVEYQKPLSGMHNINVGVAYNF